MSNFVGQSDVRLMAFNAGKETLMEYRIHDRHTVILYKFASLQSSTSVTQQLVVVQENTRAWICNEQHVEAYEISEQSSPYAMPSSRHLKYTTLLSRTKLMVCS